LTDIIVPPIACKPLTNDMLAEDLEIAVECFGKGFMELQVGAEGEDEGKRKI